MSTIEVVTRTEPLSKEQYKTNEKEDSCIELECDAIEFNIFFDGTWNSKENSDHYNNPDRPLEERNDPKYNPRPTILGFSVSESISFARAPTGVDQIHRAIDTTDPHKIALYVDGAGTETPLKLPDGTKQYTGDNIFGAGTGWGATGVYGKLRTMFKQIQQALQNYANTVQTLPTMITFNVYGFSRGAATARMFCNRVINQKDNLREVLQYVNLLRFDTSLKFVGLFDTVSSVGFSHTNDVESDDQGLDFCVNQVLKIVHIAAAHEYRQKFNLTNIAVPVKRGYGLEIVLPGCHTDIGDGLGTEGEVVNITVEDSDMQLPIKQQDWYINARDDKEKAILQRKKKFNANPNKVLWSINPIAVSRAESIAKQSNQYANYTIVRQNLIHDGWFEPEEIFEREFDNKYEQLIIDRKQVSQDYPKIPAHLMIELSKNYGAYYLLEDKLKLYAISSAEKPKELQAMYENLKTQVLAMDLESNKLAITKIREDQKNQQPRVDIKGNEALRKTMYNRYLHWGSSMEQGFGSDLLQVNIAHIDHTTNQFYRTIVSG